jgi:hypothetical protein
MLTEDELNWIRNVLDNDDPVEISPSYFYRKKTQIERNANKGIVRKELDKLRKKITKFTPQELIELRIKNVREIRGIENFPGIYLIHNRVKDMYYVGQAERVFDRAYQHFVINPATKKERHELNVLFNLREIYEDYSSGDEFRISLIPLENTLFSSLNELEDNAIRAYDSLLPNGYNRNPGNIMDSALIFKNDDYQKAADLILDNIKGTELILSLSNNLKRWAYTKSLISELRLPNNAHFIVGFAKVINEYQKANKKVFIRNDQN